MLTSVDPSHLIPKDIGARDRYGIRTVIMSEGATNEYYQHAQIIQGALIFLSACVAVVGHIVQSNLRAKERKEELRNKHEQYLRQNDLKNTREQIEMFMGPAYMLSFELWFSILTSFYRRKVARMVQGIKEGEPSPDSIFGKEVDPRAITHWEESQGFNFGNFLAGHGNLLEGFVGPEIEAEIRADPKSTVGRNYLKACRRIVLDYALPLRDLLLKHAQSKSNYTTKEKFKKHNPGVSSAAFGRNLFYLQFIAWADEFRAIITEEWSVGDYTNLRPVMSSYPMQIFRYFTSQITALREKETKIGAVIHQVQSVKDGLKQSIAHLKQHGIVGSKGAKGQQSNDGKTAKYTIAVKE